MPVSVTPWRVDQILGEAVNDQYRKAELDQRAKDREIHNRMLALQEKELQGKIDRENAFQEIMKDNPQSATITTPGINQIGGLSDYAKSHGIAPIEGNPEFSQPETKTVDFPQWKQMYNRANAYIMSGFIEEGEKLRKYAMEERKDEQEYTLALGYFRKYGSEWKANMLRDYPQEADAINNTEFKPDGTAVYYDQRAGGFFYRNGDKEVFKANPKSPNRQRGTEETYDPKTHLTYGRDYTFNPATGDKKYVGATRLVKGRESIKLEGGDKSETKKDKTIKQKLLELEKFRKLHKDNLEEGGEEAIAALKARLNNGEDIQIVYPTNVVTNEFGSGLSHGKGVSQKKLDQTTATAILKEAGGDKDKAREIAKKRGYVF